MTSGPCVHASAKGASYYLFADMLIKIKPQIFLGVGHKKMSKL